MTQWLVNLLSSTGYFGIFLLMVLENVIPPIPSEAIMGLSGIAAAQGQMNAYLVVIIGTAGTIVGNLFWFEIGRYFGYERLRPIIDRYGRWLTMEWSDVERIHDYFDKWGGATVFALQFLPFGRTMISLPAGLMHMNPWRFVLYTAAGSIIWNTALVAVGYWMGTTMDQLTKWMGPVIVVMAVVAVIAYFWRLATWKPKGNGER